MRCPEMNASVEEWQQYQLAQWKEIAKNEENPDWLKGLAEDITKDK